jgi:hypothetical protein
MIRTPAIPVGTLMLAALLACGDSTGPATSRNDPGTGSSTLRVTADIDANDQPDGSFNTDFEVTVRDGAGSRVSGATVSVDNALLGSVALAETSPGSGDYAATRSSFPSGDFRLTVVRGTDNVRNAVLGGPGVQQILTPAANAAVTAGQPLTVRWSVPSRAQAAQVETRDFDSAVLPDTGAVVIPGTGNPAATNQRIRVYRYNEVSLAGGLPGSRLRVTVRNSVEPVVVQ